MPGYVPSDGRVLLVFSHVNADKAGLYRAVLRVFMEAKAAFALHLRPADVRTALRNEPQFDESDAGGLEAALSQLCEWGNLEAHRDTADVATVEEFYRPRFVYQLTAEGEAHRLWRAAFGLAPARHLRVDEDTLEKREQDPVPPQTSWLKAEPLWISPRVRQSGRHIARGTVRSVIDRTKEKELLARLSRDESHLLAAAQRRFANARRMRLSEIGELGTAAELDLFLDLLGEALAGKVRPDETVIAHSSDGALRIELEPAGDGREAVVPTPDGLFRGEDHYLTISGAFGEVIEDMRDSVSQHEH